MFDKIFMVRIVAKMSKLSQFVTLFFIWLLFNKVGPHLRFVTTVLFEKRPDLERELKVAAMEWSGSKKVSPALRGLLFLPSLWKICLIRNKKHWRKTESSRFCWISGSDRNNRKTDKQIESLLYFIKVKYLTNLV